MRVLVLVLLVACSSPRADPAEELETHLVAPCCWRQTLADHESPLANELRAEIRTRLANGEGAEAVEADLVKRYGARIHALEGSTGDPRILIGAVTAGAVVLGLALLGLLARRGRTESRREPVDDEPDELANRLDDELAAVD
jgi:cytochrome c-type biogenesis protein CcmH